MSTVTGTYRNGRIELDQPVDWPEGKHVRVSEVADEEPEFMTEETWPKTPEEIEEHIRQMKAVESVILTEKEKLEIAAWRDEIRRVSTEDVRRQMGLTK